mmetsp:Transcript_44682/g.129131  ORF Transcript_44682/g.129131 Transcript_44682/m.129131 type:complete len:265 (+) Transcript_44682:1389-2183(+)
MAFLWKNTSAPPQVGRKKPNCFSGFQYFTLPTSKRPVGTNLSPVGTGYCTLTVVSCDWAVANSGNGTPGTNSSGFAPEHERVTYLPTSESHSTTNVTRESTSSTFPSVSAVRWTKQSGAQTSMGVMKPKPASSFQTLTRPRSGSPMGNSCSSLRLFPFRVSSYLAICLSAAPLCTIHDAGCATLAPRYLNAPDDKGSRLPRSNDIARSAASSSLYLPMTQRVSPEGSLERRSLKPASFSSNEGSSSRCSSRSLHSSKSTGTSEM